MGGCNWENIRNEGTEATKKDLKSLLECCNYWNYDYREAINERANLKDHLYTFTSPEITQ